MIGPNHEGKVRWLLDFAYRDFAALRQSDIAALRRDLADVLRKSIQDPLTVLGSAEARGYIVKADTDWFRGLQIRLSDFFRERYQSPRMRLEVTETESIVQTTLRTEESEALELRFRIRAEGFRGWTILNLVSDDGEESAESEILFIALVSLGTTDTSRVLLCPSCEKRLFWRVRRQRYCSAECRNKESYQAWLGRPRETRKPKKPKKKARKK